MIWISGLLILFSVLVYGALHSWLASLGVKDVLRQTLGAPVDRIYRLLYNLFAILTFLPLLGLVGFLPSRSLYRVPLPWAALLLAVQVLAVVMLVLGLLQTGPWRFLGISQLLGAVDEEADYLVTAGVYRWVRHPLYTAGLLFIWATPLMTSNLLALNLGLTLYLIGGAWLEERKLAQQYGEAYQRYRQHTPMLIPGLKIGFTHLGSDQ